MVHSPGFEPGTLQIYSLLPLTARPTVESSTTIRNLLENVKEFEPTKSIFYNILVGANILTIHIFRFIISFMITPLP